MFLGNEIKAVNLITIKILCLAESFKLTQLLINTKTFYKLKLKKFFLIICAVL